MKRRKAIHKIAIISSAIALFPSCETEVLPVYENIPLDKKQRKLIELLADAILPKNNIEITTPEKTVDYILTMVNDCHSPEDIKIYSTGLNEFQVLLNEKYNANFNKLKPEKIAELFNFINSPENTSENIKQFYSTTYKLTKRQFTTSEYFMKNYLDFEFAPGRYLGCVEV